MNRSLVLALAVLALALLACVLPGQPTLVIQCTAPACVDGDLYCPGGDCPGGCGTRCATWTPDSNAPPPLLALTAPSAPEAFCQIIVRAPPPEAPTASVNGTPQPHRRVDPHVEICASAPEVSVGEQVTLVGRAVDIGQPGWMLAARENGASDFLPVADIAYTGPVTHHTGPTNVLVVAGAQTTLIQLVVTLTAVAAGEAEFIIRAHGEIHFGSPGPATWGGRHSEVVRIVVR